MLKQTHTLFPKAKNRFFLLGTIIILLILVLLIAPGPADSFAAANVQPALLAMATEDAQSTVRVIVQKSSPDASIEFLVTELDGTVLKDLHIINAVVATMPAGNVPFLAQSEAVRWVSLDGPVANSGKPPKDPAPEPLPENFYLDTLNVRPVWEMGYTGQGVTVAVIDSGIFTDRDFSVEPGKPHTRLIKNLNLTNSSATSSDLFGHGTHVAGIIGGHGGESGGLYSGVAPGIEIINLKILDDFGMAYESDTVDALQWVLDNKDAYNIRVVNLSVNSSTEQSYHTSPLDAAAEILWFNGIVVVASAGNRSADWSWDTINTAPANDPFIITVGSSHENYDAYRSNDYMAIFSANDITADGFMKPDVVAPGKDIVSVLSSGSDWYYDYPERSVMDKEYFRISGTSMSAPMVSGAVALLLQAEPNLTPDQVKYRLMNTGSTIYGDFPGADFAYLDVYDLITTTTTESANTGIEASQLLWTGDDPITWGSVNWGSVNWGSVNWGSVNWGSVNWGSVNWGSVSWDE
jgi:serine protease AprX